jgi:LacI family transcriptional regulator
VAKRLTLEEIGRLAGVSRSTVSRVINGHDDVSDDVKERVLQVVSDTGYRPNRAARSLVSSRTGLLGLVIPSGLQNLFQDPYFGRLIRGITRRANAAEQTISLFLFDDRDEEIDLYERVIADGMVDGVLLTATSMHDPIVGRMQQDGMPFVMIGRPDQVSVPYVDVENVKGANAATKHLIEHGCRRLATIAGPSNTTTGVDRRTGFLDAAAAADIEVSSGLVAEADFTSRGAFDAMTRLLENRPDAVFCASDTMAIGALAAIKAAGLSCPSDVAVVSFDDLVEAHQTTPSLTTVAQPVERTGGEAVGLLLDVLREQPEEPPRVLLPTELVVRSSCGCAG